MPGAQKTMDQFQADDIACREYAYSAVGGPDAAQQANNQAWGNVAVGSALGAAVGAIIGAAGGQAGHGAAIGAGMGLLGGSAAGGNQSGYSQAALQRNYDGAYLQCMYTRGNQVPGRVAYRSSAPTPRPSAAELSAAGLELSAAELPGTLGVGSGQHAAELSAAERSAATIRRRRRGPKAPAFAGAFVFGYASRSVPPASSRVHEPLAVLARGMKADFRPALHRHLQIEAIGREEHRVAVDVGGQRCRLLALEVSTRVSSGNVNHRAVAIGAGS